jgi:HlyD family secretion protein
VKGSGRGVGLALGGAAAVTILYLWLRPTAVPVDVAQVERGTLEVTVDEEGKTRVRDRFSITAPVAGRVERILLHQGDAIETGTVAARIHPLPLDPRTRAEATARLAAAEATRREADAGVERAGAALDQATRAATRARGLASKGVLSSQDFELAELAESLRQKELEASTFAARAAEFDVEAARAALLAPEVEADGVVVPGDGGLPSCVELRSPIDGRVLRVLEESERFVRVGEPLVELGDPSALEIVIDVLSTEAVKVKAGNRVRIEDWGGEGTLDARVRMVEPSGVTKISALGVEEQRVNVIADFVGRSEDLGDGYRVEARIVVWEGRNVVHAPRSSVFRRGTAWNVFVVEGGRARRREIEIGARGAFEIEVVRGLEPGETIIVYPDDRIDDAVRVQPR